MQSQAAPLLDSCLVALRRRLPPGAALGLDEDRARAIRARQVEAVLHMTPAAMTANVGNAVLVVAAFGGVAATPWLLTWLAVIVAVALRGLLAWWNSRTRPPARGASPRAIKRAEVHASALALLWALAPVLLFATAGSSQQLLLGTLTTGMICAGGFALASVPTAATAYVVMLGIGGAAAIYRSGDPLTGVVSTLLVIYCGTVIWAVWTTARMFTARLLAEADAARQHEVIGLLLRDFEESASDVLWEADADGRIHTGSARLTNMLGLPDPVLVSAPLPELLESLAVERRATDAALHTQVLREKLQACAPFRDVVINGVRRGEMRWWSLSAKPHYDRAGDLVGWRGVVSDITDAHTATQQLQWLAHHDSLTGLGNRYQFRTRLAQVLAAPQEPGCSTAVVYADLDHFKSLNDTLGHAVGDAVLRVMGDRLLRAVRPTDMVARLGGDEFALLVPCVRSTEEVEQLCRRILKAVTEPCEVSGLRYRVRCSMGIALAPMHGEDVDALLSHADLALYAAKSGGRNEVRLFTPDMAAHTRRRLAIEEGLRDAIVRRQFRLVFQPKISLRTRQVLGFEALLRWRHPALDEVSPSEFVPIAEESGQIGPIGQWVLETACREAARWPGELLLAVNVSPVQAVSSDLVAQVQRALDLAGLPPSRLELEITESALLNEDDASARTMQRLRTLGCRLTLDDFGTGYSALSYLRQFAFNALKVDRSLMSGLALDSGAQAIVRMIVSLARTLDMETVAEGVEEPSQLDALARYGCDSAQGYLISRPLPPDDIRGFLAAYGARQPLSRQSLSPDGGFAERHPDARDILEIGASLTDRPQ